MKKHDTKPTKDKNPGKKPTKNASDNPADGSEKDFIEKADGKFKKKVN